MFLAFSMLGILAAAAPTPINAKKGINDPLKTVSTSTPRYLTASINPSEKAAPKKMTLPL